MNNIDILDIDNKIREKFENELKKIEKYQKRLDSLSQINTETINDKYKSMIEAEIKDLQNNIQKLERCEDYNFYLSESLDIITKYKKILNTPIKISFMGKSKEDNKEKDRIIKEYIDICSKYTDISNYINDKPIEKISTVEIVKCNNCDNDKEFYNIDDSIFICEKCSSQQELLLHTSSHKDIDRVNISVKYTYDRKIHFRDAINQYQGKQNSNIEDYIYDDLEKQLELHHLLTGDKNSDKKIRFNKVTKEHIYMFLKELGYSKHYENVNLIHYNLTGKLPDDISYLEDKLLDDFDRLSEMYDKKYKGKKGFERKNFINTQVVLLLLLNRHGHPCKKESFTLLKTIDRREFHDEIMRDLFSSLGWSFII